MGLDMYLFAAPKIEGMKLEEILSASINLAKLREENSELYSKIKDYVKHFEVFDFKWDSLLSEVMYWRKVNHIHNWFVDNIQGGVDDNGALSEVKRDQVIELYNCCKMAIADKPKASDLLPTMPGPFFGGIEYDSFYFHETKRTLDKLKEFIETSFFEKNYLLYLLYQSSW